MKTVNFFETIKETISPEGKVIPKGTIFRSRAEMCPCRQCFGWLVFPHYEEVAYLDKDDIIPFEGYVVLDKDGDPTFFGTYDECAEWAYEEGLEVLPISSFSYEPGEEDEETTSCDLCPMGCKQKDVANILEYVDEESGEDERRFTVTFEVQMDNIYREPISQISFKGSIGKIGKEKMEFIGKEMLHMLNNLICEAWQIRF